MSKSIRKRQVKGATGATETEDSATGNRNPAKTRNDGGDGETGGNKGLTLSASGLVFAIAVALHINTLEGGFVFDDARGIVTNPDVLQTNSVAQLLINDFWGKPMARFQSHKSYRPITVLSFRLNHHFGGLDPFPFHVCNLVLHALVCVLYLHVAHAIFQRTDLALAAALLFVTHSIHTECVANIVGRAEVLGGLFVLLSFLAYDVAARRTERTFAVRAAFLSCSMGLAAAAMLSKEQGITILGILFVYDAVAVCQLNPLEVPAIVLTGGRHGHKGMFCRTCSILFTGVVLVVFRVLMMGDGQPIFNEHELPAMGSRDSLTRLLTFNYYAAFNLQLLLFPSLQSSDWSYGSIPLLTSKEDPRCLVIVAAYGMVMACAVFCLKSIPFSGARTAPNTALKAVSDSSSPEKSFEAMKPSSHQRLAVAGVMGLTWMGLTFLPSSNLFFHVGFVVAERVLYLPSMGFCILAGIMLDTLSRKSKTLSYIVFGFALLLLSGRTLQRNSDWRSDFTLHEAGAAVLPGNIKMVTNYGMMLHERAKDGRRSEHERRKYLQQTEDTYKRALDHIGNQSFPNVYFVYGNLMQESGRDEQALKMYEEGLKRKDHTRTTLNILSNMGTLRFKRREFDLAEKAFRFCLEIDNEHMSAHNGLAVLYASSGRSTEAEVEFKETLKLRPDYIEALFNYGTLLAKVDGRLEESKRLLRRALKVKPDHHGAKTNLEYVEFMLKKK